MFLAIACDYYANENFYYYTAKGENFKHVLSYLPNLLCTGRDAVKAVLLYSAKAEYANNFARVAILKDVQFTKKSVKFVFCGIKNCGIFCKDALKYIADIQLRYKWTDKGLYVTTLNKSEFETLARINKIENPQEKETLAALKEMFALDQNLKEPANELYAPSLIKFADVCLNEFVKCEERFADKDDKLTSAAVFLSAAKAKNRLDEFCTLCEASAEVFCLYALCYQYFGIYSYLTDDAYLEFFELSNEYVENGLNAKNGLNLKTAFLKIRSFNSSFSVCGSG
jgi:hypothetical protein